MVRSASAIRQQFLDFFRAKQHQIVASSPVVPHNDPTLMFANAGMNQFKDVFLGSGDRPYTRAADSQKCIRAGGKHNDLDDVGQDTYHHTFFEMLGNWSFGDYFKPEAITWAWELLTDVWQIDPRRLHATYFEGDAGESLEPDHEARDLWLELLPADQVHAGNKKDNFWEMGETGPCGPCSEIHVDLTDDRSGGRWVNTGDPQVIEIWNLVFIQYNRGSDSKLAMLPARHVDTGMGFERICAVLQGKTSNYDTDVFTPIFEAIQRRTGAPTYHGTLPTDASANRAQVLVDVTYRVIADHLRCLAFAITDGGVPGNEGRGYVLRRILRRAVRYGRQYFNMHEAFIFDLVPAMVDTMGAAFPELRAAHQGGNVEHVQAILRDEEESFGDTLDRGIKLFNDAADYARKHHHGRVSGIDAFKLHDTYGFPIDLTELMAAERQLTVNIGEYERLMEEARAKARRGSGAGTAFDLNIVTPMPATDDQPKYAGASVDAVLLGYVIDGAFRTTGDLPVGATIALVLDTTCFYGEQGGQVGDTGRIDVLDAAADPTASPAFQVDDTRRFGDTVLHVGTVVAPAGRLHIGDPVRATVAAGPRRAIEQNHTATHLLNWALREVLGAGVQQKGSLVDADKTRFDFAHAKPVSAAELIRVETLVGDQVAADYPVFTAVRPQAHAREVNTLRAVFGEKYPDEVRIVSIGAEIDALLAEPAAPQWLGHSVEFCGGTHVASTGQIARFVLVTEEGVAKGVRRVVGLSGAAADRAAETGQALLTRTRQIGELAAEQRPAAVQQLQADFASATVPVQVAAAIRDQLATAQQQVRAWSKAKAAETGDAVLSCAADLLDQAESLGDVTIVIGQTPPASADALRGAIDWIRQKTDASAVLLACAADGKVTLLAGMSRAVVERQIKAGDLIRAITPLVDGKGGGRPDMAQGGGQDPDRLDEALAEATAWLRARLTS